MPASGPVSKVSWWIIRMFAPWSATTAAMSRSTPFRFSAISRMAWRDASPSVISGSDGHGSAFRLVVEEKGEVQAGTGALS